MTDDHESLADIRELRVTMRMRNNRMVTMRARWGLSQRALALRAGVPFTHVAAIERFGVYTGRNSFSYETLARSIGAVAEVFGVSPIELAPPELFDAIRQVDAEREVSAEAALALDYQQMVALPAPDPDRPILAREIVRRYLPMLTPRQEMVLRRYLLEDVSFADIGREMNVSLQTVKNIYDRAIGRIRRAMMLDEVAVAPQGGDA